MLKGRNSLLSFRYLIFGSAVLSKYLNLKYAFKLGKVGKGAYSSHNNVVLVVVVILISVVVVKILVTAEAERREVLIAVHFRTLIC